MIKEFFSKKRTKKERKQFFKKISHLFVKTGDATYTYEDPVLRETMHSITGAYDESVHKFCKPANIEKRTALLDLFSGFGYNATAALERNPNLHIEMIEKGSEILAMALLIPDLCGAHRTIKSAIEDSLYKNGIVQNKVYERPENVHLSMVDALTHEYSGTVDVVFHDAYSPKHDWRPYSVGFFEKLYNVMDEHGVLLTYSSSSSMRAGLLEAGFYIGGTTPHRRRRAGTIASKRNEGLRDLSRREERTIALTDRGIPYSEQKAVQRKSLRNHVLFSPYITLCFENIYHFGERFHVDAKEQERAEKSIRKMGIARDEAMYIICPQYDICICGECSRRYGSTTERIIAMRHRLLKCHGGSIDDPIRILRKV